MCVCVCVCGWCVGWCCERHRQTNKQPGPHARHPPTNERVQGDVEAWDGVQGDGHEVAKDGAQHSLGVGVVWVRGGGVCGACAGHVGVNWQRVSLWERQCQHTQQVCCLLPPLQNTHPHTQLPPTPGVPRPRCTCTPPSLRASKPNELHTHMTSHHVSHTHHTWCPTTAMYSLSRSISIMTGSRR
jgi:hypothetical protein